MLSNMVAASYMGLFELKLNHGLFFFFKLSISVTLTTFQMLNRHVWLVAAILDSADTDHFHHCQKFQWRLQAVILSIPSVGCSHYTNQKIKLPQKIIKIFIKELFIIQKNEQQLKYMIKN